MRHLAATSLALVALVALAAPAAVAQAEIWTRSTAPSGRAVEGSPGGAAFLGDLDGDQVANLALPVEATGIVEFRAGADWTEEELRRQGHTLDQGYWESEGVYRPGPDEEARTPRAAWSAAQTL